MRFKAIVRVEYVNAANNPLWFYEESSIRGSAEAVLHDVPTMLATVAEQALKAEQTERVREQCLTRADSRFLKAMRITPPGEEGQ